MSRIKPKFFSPLKIKIPHTVIPVLPEIRLQSRTQQWTTDQMQYMARSSTLIQENMKHIKPKFFTPAKGEIPRCAFLTRFHSGVISKS
jgi:hypothetical protein